MAPKVVLLDTSFLILALRPSSTEAAGLMRWLADGARIRISTIAWAEFLCGPLDGLQRDLARRIFGDPEPLIAEDSELAADLFNRLGRRRGTLLDCMIAATAIRLDAALATSKPKDFSKIDGLKLI